MSDNGFAPHLSGLSEMLQGGDSASSPTVPPPTPFDSMAWLKAWHDAHAPHERETMRALRFVDMDGAAGGLVPLSREGAKFGFKGVLLGTDDLGAPDHCDLLLPDDATARSLAGVMSEHEWERLRILNLAANAPRALAFASELVLQGHLVHRHWAFPCFYIDLPRDIDAYMSSLGSRFREGVRRKSRKLRKDFDITVRKTPAELRDETLLTLFQWNRERFGQGSAFHAPQLEALLLDFCAWLDKRDQLWLRGMECDGKLAACWLGFAWGGCMYFYQAGWDAVYARHGIGNVLMLEMIQDAITQGVERFDFLRGDEAYKQHWANGLAYTWNLTVYRKGLKGAALNCLESGWRSAHPLARVLKRRLLRREE